jgi:hypothetical protein
MASKKYRDQLCVYCSSRPSETADHIIARQFFLPGRRDKLPKAPSCKRCNNRKSKLEHYLTALLPFGGRHPDAHENLVTAALGRLAKNVPLHRDLRGNQGRMISLENGIYRPTMTLPFESESLSGLFVLITRGLAWYHWKVLFTDEHEIRTLFLSDHGRKLFERLFHMKASQQVKIDLGEGTIRYEGSQLAGCAHSTVWRFQIYGGLLLAGDPNAPQVTSSEIGTLSGPSRILREWGNCSEGGEGQPLF